MTSLPLSSLQAYLQMMVEFRSSQRSQLTVEGFVLRHGRIFSSEVLTPSELKIVQAAYKLASRRCFFEQRECWWNAKALVKADRTKTLRYVEGYGRHLIPTLHAWAEINGKVVDMTWRVSHLEEGSFENWNVGRFSTDFEYHGVVFSSDELAQWTPKDKSSLLDNWKNQWKLIRSDFRLTPISEEVQDVCSTL